jgi:hypothetical protein
MVRIEQLAEAVLNGEGLTARSLVQDLFSERPRLADISRSPVDDERILAASASLLELFASRWGQDAPVWTKDISSLAEPTYLLKSINTMKRLRKLCEQESPESLRKRGSMRHLTFWISLELLSFL